MKASEVVKVLLKHGWVFERQKGSHKTFKHPDNPNLVTIPEHGKKDIPSGTLRQIWKKAGL
ncbi:type II toxin-antitoxin system HicA family toxin [Pinibacter aurantiacus]|uniref:Type II toxin-antitoxin system HicA family toxin n=1 Tax=Pinibacter aurantiacus TaxID=2851599 RepID=A0A9E2S6S5_9BACT|nr:type II toxin-antitoxin system HicA family toxin [Pinibacter aurantiacus]MBV4357623.1 type II toxin-antitoxin system HicA family toxin [Pinibacter aurantiacus]